jgi:pimeloyl-ACP methyl ester carboxylesterase
VIEDGIERISYYPHTPRYQTPIVMQHGMWHGAWCWENWQQLLAEKGWESHAHSLPGHALSPVQRPIVRCTLPYYLAFLKREMARHEHPPVLMGHSLGGALTQWYLKHVRDDLPAAVLVAPWVAKSAMQDGLPLFLKLDPFGALMQFLVWSSTPYIRTPQRAYAALLSDAANVDPATLHAKLNPESALILFQHNPPFWSPPTNVNTPLLWLAAEQDAVVSLDGQRASAAHYNADLHVVEQDGHNLMMDAHYPQTADAIHEWLVAKGIE